MCSRRTDAWLLHHLAEDRERREDGLDERDGRIEAPLEQAHGFDLLAE
jgi:hypothetical protein